MNEITLMFLLLWSSGSHLTSAVYVRSPEEVVVGNGTTDTEAVLNQQSSGALMQKGPRPHDCGVPAIKPRVPGCPSDGLGIINGEEAVPHSWPWQVSLQTYWGFHFCGGSLINKDWVVTAAHCDVSTLNRVILGQHNLTHTQIQRMTIGKVFTHPEYNGRLSEDYDIALIKLQSPAQMNDRVSPVCVAETSDDLANGMECVTTGWGRTSHRPPRSPDKLQQVCVPLISDTKCNSYRFGEITSQMLCAGAAGADTCQGDSGGPLVCKMDGAWTLVGVTSWGLPGCPTSMPGVYSSIIALRAWMDETMDEN